MSSSSSNVSTAATIVLWYRRSDGTSALHMLKRSSKSTFMPEMYVFPGGRAEDADMLWAQFFQKLNIALGIHWDSEETLLASLKITALRETWEECGISLNMSLNSCFDAKQNADIEKIIQEQEKRCPESMQQHVCFSWLQNRQLPDFDSIQPLTHWTTPHEEKKRFSAQFFSAQVPEYQAIQIDQKEMIGHLSATPQDVLNLHQEGLVRLAPPTFAVLEDFCIESSFSEMIKNNLVEIKTILPVMIVHESETIFALPGDPLHPSAARAFPHRTRIVMHETGILESQNT